MSERARLQSAGLLAAAVLAGALAGFGGGLLAGRPTAPPAAPVTPAAPAGDKDTDPRPAPGPSEATGHTIAAAARKINPAVVNIDNIGRKPGPGFNPWEDLSRPPGAREPVLRGSGSGFVFNAAKGWVMTNQHVVEGAEKLEVTLDDGRVLEAKPIGADQLSDIAVLEIAPERLPEAPLGLKARLEPGEWVIAIGNPFRDFPHTVTVGVVSALNRNMQIPGRDYSNLIQTDAAINMGNSGGPLCNLAGEVIGVNAAIFSPTQTYAGIGFAIVIDDAMQIAAHLIESGGVPWLGVAMSTLSEEQAARVGLAGQRGVVVDQVREDSPAARGGLLPEDVIISLDGQPLTDAATLQQRVLAGGVGDTLKLKVLRAGQERALKVVLGARPKQ